MRGEFSRAAWAFDVVPNLRQQEISEQKRSQVYDFASIFARFALTLIQLLKILMDTKFEGFIEH